jgi:hypothetical protein
VSDRTYARDVESTGFSSGGLPDSPEMEMRLAQPHDDGDGPQPPTAGALFPEVVTWTDDQLITAIELADRQEPALRLASPDDYDAFLDACSAELVRRLERRGVAMAA